MPYVAIGKVVLGASSGGGSDYDGFVYVDFTGRTQWTGTASPGTDVSDIVQAAIRSRATATVGSDTYYQGAHLLIPPGRWRLSNPVYVDRPGTHIQGSGGDGRFGSTVFYCDAGVSGFICFPQGTAAPGDANPAGSNDFIIENIKVNANGRLTTTGTGSWNSVAGTGAVNLTLAAAGDFEDNQIISVVGAGASSDLKDVYATTTAGDATVTITGPQDGQYQGIKVGMTLRIPGVTWAGSNKCRVLSVPSEAAMVGVGYDYDIEMEQVASAGVTLAQVEYVRDLQGRIVSGGGTTSLILDVGGGENATNAVVEHADCAMYITSRGIVRDCSFGDPGGWYFKGFNICLIGGNSFSPSPGTNTNMAGIVDCVMYNGAGGGVYLFGGDNNQLHIGVNCNAINGVKSYCVIDCSALGVNYHWPMHTTGGFGILGLGNGGAAAYAGAGQLGTINGWYNEGGTYCSVGPGWRNYGGNPGGQEDMGGQFDVGIWTTRQQLGTTNKPWSVMEQRFEPSIGFSWRAATAQSGTNDTRFRPIISSDATSIVGWAFAAHTSGQNRTVMMIPDTTDTTMAFVTAGENACYPIFHRGIAIGEAYQGGTLSGSNSNPRMLVCRDSDPGAVRTYQVNDTAIRNSSADIGIWAVAAGTGATTTPQWDRIMRNTVAVRKTNQTDVGNVGAGDDTLHSWTMPASQLATNGDAVVMESTITFAGNANNKRVRAKFGSTTIYDSTAVAQNAGVMKLRVRVVRTGATSQEADYDIRMSNGSTIPSTVSVTTAAETLSGALAFSVTGESSAAASNDIVAVSTRWFFEPASP